MAAKRYDFSNKHITIVFQHDYMGGCEFVSTSSGLASMASGGKFWQGFATGAVSSFVSSATDGICKMCEVPKGWTKAAVVAAGCLSGGVTATMAGGNFWEGVCSGLICAGLNHAMHLVVDGGEKILKQYLKGIERFEHFPQKDALMSTRNNVFGNKQRLCKYACLEMIEKFFFGSNGRGQLGLSNLNVDENQAMLPFFQKLSKGMNYSVFSIDGPSQIAESLASGDPIVLTEWNPSDDSSINGHSVVIVGIEGYSNGDYNILYYDPLSSKGQVSTKSWSKVSESFNMCRFGKHNQ